MLKRSAESIIEGAEALLQTACFGLEDMKTRPARSKSGLLNVIVFGRSVTFGLQNLRSVVDNFDEWYSLQQQELKADPIASYFSELRTRIEKQAQQLPVGVRTHIESFSVADMKHFNPAPPNAKALIIGDASGGSGWKVSTPQGVDEMYYIDLPRSIGVVDIVLLDAPKLNDRPNMNAVDMAQAYLATLSRLLKAARVHFLPA